MSINSIEDYPKKDIDELTELFMQESKKHGKDTNKGLIMAAIHHALDTIPKEELRKRIMLYYT